MTIEKCLSACFTSEYTIAGVEYAGECWCDTQYRLGGGPAPDGDTQCNMPCNGNATQNCGGPNRLNVFEYTPATNVPVVPTWEYLGCYSDNVNARSLRFGVNVAGQNGHESCQAACLNAGYPFSGTEYSAECYCDTAISNGGGPAADGEAGCNMPCQAAATEMCGGANRLTVFHYTGNITTTPGDPPPVVNPPEGGSNVAPVTTGLPTTWHYSGCYM
jgi:hypothetical protein